MATSPPRAGECIGFDGVRVVTPGGVQLVTGLSFEIKPGGDSLLLVGHNGAGKSSIFRCLAGLWGVPAGRVTKPEDFTDAVFYIPQRAYNVLGTLQEQITYPSTTDAKALTRARLAEILAVVDLAHYIDAPGYLTDEVDWENAISYGERQRLAIARLVYQRPRFAIKNLETFPHGAGQNELKCH